MIEINFAHIGSAVLPMMVVWVRISAFLAFVPFFSSTRTSAVMFKTAFSLFISILLVNTLPVSSWQLPTQALPYVILLSGEVFVGILIALSILTLFMVLQMLGDIMGFQMAFSMARVIDASMGSQSNIISVLMVSIGTVIFLSLGGDHILLSALRHSFDIVPPGQVMIGKELIDVLFIWLSRSFELGVKVAFPGIILLLTIDLILGLIGRTASKMQIFFVGLPLKISMGLYLFVVGVGFAMTIWGRELTQLPHWLGRMFGLIRA